MSDKTWMIIIVVAVIGALAYFIIGDWFNTAIQNADPFGKATGAAPSAT